MKFRATIYGVICEIIAFGTIVIEFRILNHIEVDGLRERGLMPNRLWLHPSNTSTREIQQIETKNFEFLKNRKKVVLTTRQLLIILTHINT